MKVNLKAARVNAGLTQKQVATAIGVSRDILKALENGKRDIKVREFDALCELYGCSRDDIFLHYNSPKSELNASKPTERGLR